MSMGEKGETRAPSQPGTAAERELDFQPGSRAAVSFHLSSEREPSWNKNRPTGPRSNKQQSHHRRLTPRKGRSRFQKRSFLFHPPQISSRPLYIARPLIPLIPFSNRRILLRGINTWPTPSPLPSLHYPSLSFSLSNSLCSLFLSLYPSLSSYTPTSLSRIHTSTHNTLSLCTTYPINHDFLCPH